jgi:uncharacterized protein (TIGR00251 family)
VQPGGGENRIEGVVRAADGQVRLKVRVTAAAESGKANRALIKLLAKAWRLPAGGIELVVGAKARNKVLLVEGEPEAVSRRLEAWLAKL